MPFRSIAGHRPLLALLARATARRSLPPSLLFAGPDGVGKRLTAIALAQALNCERPVPFAEADTTAVASSGTSDAAVAPGAAAMDACGSCAACRRIARGVHADVLLVEP